MDKWRLDQPAFVVPFFGPGVRKENMHPCQRVGGDHVAKDFDGIVLNDTDICKPGFVDAAQQGPHAGIEDLNPQKVVMGARQRDFSVVSPMPKPISRMVSARRPNTSSKSSSVF